jgi:hypothetical protein
MSDLEDRVVKLERRNRWMSALLAAAGAIICGVVFLAAKPTSTRDVEVRSLQTQELWLVGENGEKLGFWTPRGLAVTSPDSKQGIILHVDRDKTKLFIEMWSPNANTKLQVDSERTGIVTGFGKLDDPRGGGKVAFFADKTDGSGFTSDSSGNVSWRTK